MPNVTTTAEKMPRVRGDLLARLRASHANRSLRTQQGLATHSDGMATRTVARAEDGYASFETVERLALTLGVSPWDLWIPIAGEAAPPPAHVSALAGTHEDEPAWVSRLEGKIDRLIYIEENRT